MTVTCRGRQPGLPSAFAVSAGVHGRFVPSPECLCRGNYARRIQEIT